MENQSEKKMENELKTEMFPGSCKAKVLQLQRALRIVTPKSMVNGAKEFVRLQALKSVYIGNFPKLGVPFWGSL